MTHIILVFFWFYLISFFFRFALRTLKKLRFIFIFIFLTGMLYTVFQYVPILEEETAAHKIELAKKIKQNAMDGDSDPEDEDCDDDSETDLKYNFSEHTTSFYSHSQFHYTKQHNFYKYQLANIHTPPPKA